MSKTTRSVLPSIWLVLRSTFVVLLVLAAILAALFVALSVTWSQQRRWSPQDYSAERRAAGFDNIAQSTGIKPEDWSGLKIYLGWGTYKWIALEDRGENDARLAMLEEFGPWDNRQAALRTSKLSTAEYRQFRQQFDRLASGFRWCEVGGYDGMEMAYEQWSGPQARSYRGNASFCPRDADTVRLVVRMVRRNGGFALDDFARWRLNL